MNVIGQMNKFRHLVLRMDEIITIWHSNTDLLERLGNYWEGSLDEVALSYTVPAHRGWSVFFECAQDGVEISQTDVLARQVVHLHAAESEFLEAMLLSAELITKLALVGGTIWIHGSAFQLGDKTVLVAGRKGVGKTFWLLAALFKLGARYIGNDQLPLEEYEGIPSTRRWRPDIKIRPTTMKLLDIPLPNVGRLDRVLWMVTPGSNLTLVN